MARHLFTATAAACTSPDSLLYVIIRYSDAFEGLLKLYRRKDNATRILRSFVRRVEQRRVGSKKQYRADIVLE